MWVSLWMRIIRFLSQVQDTAQRGLLAVSRSLGHMANTDTPFAERRNHTGNGECNMPRFTPRTDEVRNQFYERPSHRRPIYLALNARKLRAASVATDKSKSVHGLFRSVVAFVAALMLWCALTLTANFVESQVQDTAQRGLLAVSRSLGHMANTDTPFAERRSSGDPPVWVI